MKTKEPRQEYADQKSIESEKGRNLSAEKYRKYCVGNFSLIGEEALIGLFGCREMHAIKGEHLLDKETVLDNEEDNSVRQPKFDKAAYQRDYMAKRRAEEKK